MPALSFWRKLVFGAGESGFSIVMTAIDVYFLFFLLTVVKLPPAYAAGAIFLGKTWDWVNDPLVGLITDRTRSRWGKRRPYLLFGALPFGCAFLLLWWIPPAGSLTLLAAYYGFAYFLYDTTLTLVSVPYYAMVPDLASTYDERTSINAYRMAFSIAAGLLAYAAPELAKLPVFGGGAAGIPASGLTGWFGAAALFAVVSVLPLGGVFLSTRGSSPDNRGAARERETLLAMAARWIAQHRRTAMLMAAYFLGWIGLFGVVPRAWPLPNVSTVWTDFVLYAGFLVPMAIIVSRTFRRNRPFLMSMTIFLLTWTTIALIQSVLPFFISYWLRGGENLTVIMAAVFVSALLWLPFWNWFARRFSKKSAYVAGMISLAVILVAISTLPPETSLVTVMVLAVLAGFGVSAAHVIPNSLIPDAIEWEELQMGRRREGFYYSVVGLLNKIAVSVAIPWVALVLGVSGFDQSRGVQQLPGAFTALRLLVGLVPGILMAVGVGVAAAYPLSREKHERIRVLLSKRKARAGR